MAFEPKNFEGKSIPKSLPAIYIKNMLEGSKGLDPARSEEFCLLTVMLSSSEYLHSDTKHSTISNPDVSCNSISCSNCICQGRAREILKKYSLSKNFIAEELL